MGGGQSALLVFFTGRSRHTRYWRDWSSDVCSSDLCLPPVPPLTKGGRRCGVPAGRFGFIRLAQQPLAALVHQSALPFQAEGIFAQRAADFEGFRSEERRVGKECRSRWSPYH